MKIFLILSEQYINQTDKLELNAVSAILDAGMKQ
jgi:hypothetical protein